MRTTARFDERLAVNASGRGWLMMVLVNNAGRVPNLVNANGLAGDARVVTRGRSKLKENWGRGLAWKIPLSFSFLVLLLLLLCFLFFSRFSQNFFLLFFFRNPPTKKL